MSFNFALNLLSFTGILNCRRNGKFVELSKSRLFLNVLKLCALIFYRKNILAFMNIQSSPSYSYMSWSSFSAGFLHVLFNYPVAQAVVTLFTFLVLSQKVVRLMNAMISLRSESSRKFPHVKVVFDEFEKVCCMNISILIIFSLLIYVQDFFATMRHEWMALLAFALVSISYFINISLLCFIYTNIQFFVHGQKALILYEMEASSDSLEAIIENISIMESSLCAIKESFISTLCLPVLTMTFYFISQIVFQVKLSNFHRTFIELNILNYRST